MAPKRIIRGHHVIFVTSLAALVLLGGWWTVFFERSIALETESRLRELNQAAALSAIMVGHSADLPQGPPPGPSRYGLELIAAAEQRPGDQSAEAAPAHAGRFVRPAPALVQAVHDKAKRRRIMVLGEGSLLFVLISVCISMLFQLMRTERNQKRRIENFISAATHEMKTPLTGIKSLLQTLVAGAVPEDQKAQLYAMGLRETERMEHLVENVLISGRLRSELYQVFPERVELRGLLEGFVAHRRRYLVGKADTVQLAWEPDTELAVGCDRSALVVVLDNLVDNALKYGGDSPEVTVRAERVAGAVEIAVEDKGIGFAPDLADTLFDPFRRGASPKSTVQHGTGLGLSITAELVKRMGGQVSAQSKGPGKGSRFVVKLKEVGS